MRRAVLVTAGVSTGLLLGWVGLERYSTHHIAPGVVAAGVPVGGLTLDQAAQKIAAATANLTPPVLTLKAGDHTLRLSAAELGWQPDPQATAAQALAAGQKGLGAKLAALRGRLQVPLIPQVNTAALKARLEAVARSLAHPPQEATLTFKGDRFVVTPDKPGLQFDTAAALQTFRQTPTETTLELLPRPVPAKVLASALQPLADQANSLLRPLTLTYLEPQVEAGGQIHTRTLTNAEVARLFTFSGGLGVNSKAVARLIAGIGQAYDRTPENARYILDSEHKLQVKPHRDGWKMNGPGARKLLETALFQPTTTQIALPVVAKPAQVQEASLPPVEQLQLLAEATTTYAGSKPDRVANVHAAAHNLDGYVVPSGGVFDFNAAIGNISPENGFKEALVISGGRTVKGVGGGVCQVSTTTFRALYKAGLPVIERNPHAYRVHWYDPIVGFDAAVYQPYLNLRMKNDTPGPLVVRTLPTPTALTVQLYGIPDGRKVTVSDPVILSTTPHPPAQYVVEPTLKRGQIVQVDWAVDGMRTRITRTITDASGQTKTDVLNSDFKPWRAVYQVGPGTEIGGRGSTLASR
ncbi:VanW family protein [Meiothermus granaticius]|uniref:Vancomycin B-type resistance protein VanW n=1 Tax=Meiothermus granaticius NBRC 107808 TaxID=1227551 RepID=A0A399F5N8_9DEIN|nr:VanW family protein [Meiothermus granaticius]RIH91548.1 Vancomycin B-type resistance protein VanW [Meiothermus granaticius NBRC 107808]